ncbi:hypothetical protein TNCV_4758271 [Trichonephila clavipes]|nr:hypothetical protein TNCV_4758271 [Trichonephila clavipes]
MNEINKFTDELARKKELLNARMRKYRKRERSTSMRTPLDSTLDTKIELRQRTTIKGPSKADTFSALESDMEWYEQQSECYLTQIPTAQENQIPRSEKRKCTMVQRKISD